MGHYTPRSKHVARPNRPHHARAVALLWMTVSMLLLIAFASLAVDVGRVYLTRGELQLAADAAARAACAELPNGVGAARTAAVSVASLNKWDGKMVVLDPTNEIAFGTWDQAARAFSPLSGAAVGSANSVRIEISRNAPLMFAQVIGASSYRVSARSTATVIADSHAYSIIGVNSIRMEDNAFTDSYRSSNGTWASNSRSDFGAVASNGSIDLYDGVQVRGDARCGVGRKTNLYDNAKVFGVRAPLVAPLRFPSVTIPVGLTDLGDITLSGSQTSTLPGGNYLIRSFAMSGNARHTWTGPVNLYFVNAYSVRDNAVIDTYQNKPANRKMYFLPTCANASWAGSHNCVADMYAPDTNFTVSESADLCGRILARTIVVKDEAGMHYDRDLPPIGEAVTAQTVSQVQ